MLNKELGTILINFVNKTVENAIFIIDHKSSKNDFTRNRVLTFKIMFLLLLRKSIKSLQLVLNELFIGNHIAQTVSSSAYNQARKKFKHTAFIALNEGAIALFYKEAKIKRWKGYRVFGVDASKIILPKTEEIEAAYGSVKIKNQHIESSYTCALFECRYDVLNHIALQSTLHPGSSYEVDLAVKMLREQKKSTDKDLDLYDRGYASYEFLSNLVHYQRHFVVRMPKNSFKKETKSLFSGTGTWSKVVTLKAPSDKRKAIEAQGLPLEITVRFVSVLLDTGEIEVLATSLNTSISRKEFKELYFLRWGVEGYYNLVKGRLNLENFTGKSLESIRQDFWSTLFITNVETIFTYDAQKKINEGLQEEQLPKKINKAVSFNAIKNMAFDIFFNEKNIDQSNEKLTRLFMTATIVQRKDRSPPREKISARKSFNFQKRTRKHVF